MNKQKKTAENFSLVVESVLSKAREMGEITRTQVEQMFRDYSKIEQEAGFEPSLSDEEIPENSYQILDYLTKTNELHYEGSHWVPFDKANPDHKLFR